MLSMPLLLAQASPKGAGWDHHDGMWGDGGWWMMIMWLLLIVAVIVAVVLVSRSLRGRNGDPTRRDAAEIARERYARGEISQEEFERIRDDLDR